MSKGFGQSIGAGLLTSIALALGFFATIVATAAIAGDLFFTVQIGAFVFAFMGAAIIGAIIGLAAGVRAAGSAQGFGTGLMAGLAGQTIVLLGLFAGLGVAINIAEEGETADEETLAWSDFPAAALFIAPAGIVASIAGAAAGTPRTRVTASPRYAASHEAPPPAFRRPQAEVHLHEHDRTQHASTVKMARCPRCTTAVATLPGQDPVCPSCGFH